jgi:hypothetical protein
MFKLQGQVLATSVMTINAAEQPQMLAFPEEVCFQGVAPDFRLEVTLMAMKTKAREVGSSTGLLGTPKKRASELAQKISLTTPMKMLRKKFGSQETLDHAPPTPSKTKAKVHFIEVGW